MTEALLEAWDKTLARLTSLSSVLGTRPYFVFGGWPRDRADSRIHGRDIQSSDLDLVFAGTIPDGIAEGASKTSFGGYRRQFDDVRVDAWTLESTLAIRRGYLPATAEGLASSTVFSVNGLTLDPVAQRLVSKAPLDDIRARNLRFACREYLEDWPCLQVFRAWELETRLGYLPDDEVLSFMRAQVQATAASDFHEEVAPHRPGLGLDTVLRIYARLQ